MTEILQYLKNPVYCKNKKPDIGRFFALILFYLLISIVIGIFAFMVIAGFHLKHRPLNFPSLRIKILYVMLLGPVVEETLFRSWLKFKKTNIVLLITILTLLSAGYLFKGKWIFGLISSFITLSLLVLILVFGQKKIETFIASHFRYFFYGSALLFGLLHATNFTGNPYVIFFFSPLLGGPQIVLGFLLGYIRMKNGLAYSMLFHMMVNLVAILL